MAIVKVKSGATKPWTVYHLYRIGDRVIGSRRSTAELGWLPHAVRGKKDGQGVEFLATIKSLDESDDFVHYYRCSPLIVVRVKSTTDPKIAVLDVEFEDA